MHSVSWVEVNLTLKMGAVHLKFLRGLLMSVDHEFVKLCSRSICSEIHNVRIRDGKDNVSVGKVTN
jgi:hypothetical protein